MSQSRLYYIDNLRILLISLVVLHHLAITYGAPGDWYFNESEAGFPEILPMAMFITANQAFFMGMFFFISALFIIPSLERKGLKKYLTDRLVRLGIPLLIFYFFLNPLTVFIHHRFIEHKPESYFQFIVNGWARGFGPLWFIEALMIFTLVYLLFRKNTGKINLKFPKATYILMFAFITGLLQFIIRIWLPIGWSMPVTNFQFPFFVQYIFLFAFGIVAFQNNWTGSISAESGKRWFIFAQVMIFIAFPLMFFLGGAAESGGDNFMGGGSWQSFTYAIWEQITGISLIIGLLGLGKKYINRQGILAKNLSDSAYGVFVFHAPLIVALSVAFFGWHIFPLLKFILLAPVALILCFGVSWLVKQIPGLKNIF